MGEGREEAGWIITRVLCDGSCLGKLTKTLCAGPATRAVPQRRWREGPAGEGEEAGRGCLPLSRGAGHSDTLGELQGEWERIQQEAAEREKRLTAADSHAQHFSEHLDKLNMWLNMMEEKLDKVKLSDMNKKDIEQTLKDLQVRAVWLIGWLAWWLAGWIRKLELSDYLLYVFSCACFCLFVWVFCVCVHLKLILSYLSVF